MIIKTDKDILDGARQKNVLLHLANCEGAVSDQVSKKLETAFPEWRKSYDGACASEQNRNYMLGKTHVFSHGAAVVCSVFAMETSDGCVDYDALEYAIGEIASELARNRSCRTVHVQDGFGMKRRVDSDKIDAIFEYYFGKSEIDLIIHEGK